MKQILITCLFGLSIINGFSQHASKIDNIKKMLELTGTGKMGVQMAQSMIGNFKKSYSNVPDDFWNDFSKELNADTLINMIIPIYDKYYSEEDIKQLTDFYQTPLGKKVISNTPQIMQESMLAGQGWGKAMAEKVYENLKKKGFIKE